MTLAFLSVSHLPPAEEKAAAAPACKAASAAVTKRGSLRKLNDREDEPAFFGSLPYGAVWLCDRDGRCGLADEDGGEAWPALPWWLSLFLEEWGGDGGEGERSS